MVLDRQTCNSKIFIRLLNSKVSNVVFFFIILQILLWLRKGKLTLFREEHLSRFVCFSDMKHFYPSVHVLVWNDNMTEFSLHSDLYPFELF